jgi:hypothetical protein
VSAFAPEVAKPLMVSFPNPELKAKVSGVAAPAAWIV